MGYRPSNSHAVVLCAMYGLSCAAALVIVFTLNLGVIPKALAIGGIVLSLALIMHNWRRPPQR